MNTQPEALRLAEWLDNRTNIMLQDRQAAAELRRLHALNAELLKELRYITSISNGQVSRVARAAIAKAEGEQA